jgi:probable HAF family extracellular repeat protein
MRNLKKLIQCVIVFVFLAASTSLSIEYEIIDLDPLGSYSIAYGINNLGQVVGVYQTASGQRAFLWTASGGMRNLGTMSGGIYSSARCINDSGQVVGWSSTIFGQEDHAFLWTTEGGMIDLGTLGGTISHAYGINDSGYVVGGSQLLSGSGHAFLWTEVGGMEDLGILPPFYSSEALGINNLVQVVGNSAGHAFLWTETGGMQALGGIGGTFSRAYGINDSGQIVGAASLPDSTNWHACMWTEFVGIQDLGTLGGDHSVALGINNSGQVVGYSSESASGPDRAFLWTDGVMQDLGTLGGDFTRAEGINDSGQVVGTSKTASGQVHACMWIPVTPETMLSRTAQFIIDEIELGNIDVELETSLLAKIGAALEALDRGNPNDAKVAMNDLKALISQVEAQTDKKITAEAAAEIIRLANEIITALEGL